MLIEDFQLPASFPPPLENPLPRDHGDGDSGERITLSSIRRSSGRQVRHSKDKYSKEKPYMITPMGSTDELPRLILSQGTIDLLEGEDVSFSEDSIDMPLTDSQIFDISQGQLGSLIFNSIVGLESMPHIETVVSTSTFFADNSSEDFELYTDSPVPLTERLCCICHTPIEEQGLFVSGNYYHKQCGVCSKCRKQTVKYQCFGELFCEQCVPKRLRLCFTCHLPIEAERVECFGSHYHPECFCCFSCCEQVKVGEQRIIQDEMFCPKCAEKVQRRICSTCNIPIIRDRIRHLSRNFHKNCFVCCQCQTILKGNDFIVHHNKVYCLDHGKQYLRTCSYCHGCIEAEILIWHGKVYHPECFVCRTCGFPLHVSRCRKFHGRPYCAMCFAKRKDESDTSHRHIVQKTNNRRDKAQEWILTRKVMRPEPSTEPLFIEAVIEPDDPIYDPNNFDPVLNLRQSI